MQYCRHEYNKPLKIKERIEEFGTEMRQWLITIMPDWRGGQWPMARTKPDGFEDATWGMLR